MLLNVGGQAGPAALLAAEGPDAVLLVETHQRHDTALPRLAGFGRSFQAPRPAGVAAVGRGGVAQHWADSCTARVRQWRSRAADGVLWVRVEGALATPLHVGLCYLAPRGSGGAPLDADSWWLRLGQDVAEAETAGLVLLAGDLNARTQDQPDWPEGAGSAAALTKRHPMDTASSCWRCAGAARCGCATGGHRAAPAGQPPATGQPAAAAAWWTTSR